MIDALGSPAVVGVVAAGVLVTAVAAGVTPGSVRRLADRTSMAVFADRETSPPIRRTLQAARLSTPPRLYVARTRLYAAVSGSIGAWVGVSAVAALGAVLRSEPDAAGRTGLAALVSEPIGVATPIGPLGTTTELRLVLLGAAALVASTAVGATYLTRRYRPRLRAAARRRRIDESLPRTVAFAYALSRGGMPFTEVLRALARNGDVFGEGATEFRVAVRDIDLLGRDVTTTVRRAAVRTPSDAFRGFCENLGSVLRSGQDLPAFLDSQYERYRDEAAERQDGMIEELATVAEMYVTVAVAGVLFLLTVLLVVGLTTDDTLALTGLVTYLGIPSLNLLCMAYLADLTSGLGGRRLLDARRDGERLGPIPAVTALPPAEAGEASTSRTRASTPDAGSERRANRERLAAYRALEGVRRHAARPLDALVERPSRSLYLTLPVAVGYALFELLPVVAAGRTPVPGRLDDVLVVAFVLTAGSFGLLYEAGQHRLRRLEAALPDLLDRLASLNEAGMTVVGSFDRIRRSELGAMDPELERIWADVRLGATVTTALRRFDGRVRMPSVTRLVTLVTSSMRASSDLGPVLRIAASEARAERRFRRTRRQEMSTYLVAIYVAFLVFLVVIVTMDAFFVPRLVEATAGLDADAGRVPVGGFLRLSDGTVAAYRLTFFHAALLQATFSGLVGGQMSAGTVGAGVKHAAIMVTVTYVVFETLPLVL